MVEINENKRVYIEDNGNVVVKNDNATIDANATISTIDGDYIIDGYSVLKLMALRHDTSCLLVRHFWIGRTSFFSISTHDIFDEKINEIQETLEKNVADAEDLKKKNFELNNRIADLKRQVDKFNSTRHWWERKLKIK